jgi:hypothetical protein
MHADDSDNASELELLNLNIALANRKKPEMKFTGLCHNGDCGEKVEKGFFCCVECREDFERLERAQKHRRVA